MELISVFKINNRERVVGVGVRKESVVKFVNNLVVDLATPANISYLWNWGSLLGLFLVGQIITGVFLAMSYCPNEILGPRSVAELGLNINSGFLIRYLHANGASAFFLCVYFHIAKGLYYGGYLKRKVWWVGIVIYLVMAATAFLGYVLP